MLCACLSPCTDVLLCLHPLVFARSLSHLGANQQNPQQEASEQGNKTREDTNGRELPPLPPQCSSLEELLQAVAKVCREMPVLTLPTKTFMTKRAVPAVLAQLGLLHFQELAAGLDKADKKKLRAAVVKGAGDRKSEVRPAQILARKARKDLSTVNLGPPDSHAEVTAVSNEVAMYAVDMETKVSQCRFIDFVALLEDKTDGGASVWCLFEHTRGAGRSRQVSSRWHEGTAISEKVPSSPTPPAPIPPVPGHSSAVAADLVRRYILPAITRGTCLRRGPPSNVKRLSRGMDASRQPRR